MGCLNNNKGFALITSLMITLLSLAIVLGILHVITRGIQTSASQKVYRNAVEASYGATNVTMYEVLPQLAKAILEVSTPTTANTNSNMASLQSAFSGINLQFTSSSDCINQKLLNDSSGTNWNSCSNISRSVKATEIKSSPDMTFRLQGSSGASFTVYSKITDTIPGTPYMSALPDGRVLTGTGGVVDTTGGGADGGGSSMSKHFVYRIEVIGERTNNPSEQGNLSVMYEY